MMYFRVIPFNYSELNKSLFYSYILLIRIVIFYRRTLCHFSQYAWTLACKLHKVSYENEYSFLWARLLNFCCVPHCWQSNIPERSVRNMGWSKFYGLSATREISFDSNRFSPAHWMLSSSHRPMPTLCCNHVTKFDQ